MGKGGWRTGEGECSQAHKQALRPVGPLPALGLGSQWHPAPQSSLGLGMSSPPLRVEAASQSPPQQEAHPPRKGGGLKLEQALYEHSLACMVSG